MSEQQVRKPGVASACPVCGGVKEAQVQLDDVQFIVACPRCNGGDRDGWELWCGPVEAEIAARDVASRGNDRAP